MKRTKANLLSASIAVMIVTALLCAGPNGFAAEGEGPLEEALTHIRERNYALAEQRCQEAMAADPDTECYARIMLAECYASQGLFQDAAAEATVARQKARLIPAETEIVTAMAQKAIERFTRAEEQLSRTAADLETALASGRKIVEARTGLGDALALFGRDQEAIEQYLAVVDGYPRESEVMRHSIGRLAILWQRGEGPEAAMANLQGIVAAYPGTPAAAFAMCGTAGIEESGGRSDSAVALYKAVASEFAGSIPARDALEGLLGLYERAEDFQEATAIADRILREYPRSSAAVRAAGVIFTLVHRRLHIQQATDALKSIADDYPETSLAPQCLVLLAELDRQEHRLDQAIGIAERLRREYSFNPVAQSAIEQVRDAYRTGINLAETERTAREVLSGSVSEQERRGALNTLYRLAVAHLSGGYTADAERVLDAAEKAFPEVSATSALRIQRGFAVMDFGLNRDAKESFRQVLHAEPGNREAYYGLVEASARLQKPEEAVQLLPAEGLTPGQLLLAAKVFEGWAAPEAGLQVLSEIRDRIPPEEVSLAEHEKDVRKRLLSSAIRLLSEELGKAERLAGVMAERAELAEELEVKQAYTARRRAYEEKVSRARQRMENFQRRLGELGD